MGQKTGMSKTEKNVMQNAVTTPFVEEYQNLNSGTRRENLRGVSDRGPFRVVVVGEGREAARRAPRAAASSSSRPRRRREIVGERGLSASRPRAVRPKASNRAGARTA